MSDYENARIMRSASEDMCRTAGNMSGAANDMQNAFRNLDDILNAARNDLGRLVGMFGIIAGSMITMESMKAENAYREHLGQGIAYGNQQFMALLTEMSKGIEAEKNL